MYGKIVLNLLHRYDGKGIKYNEKGHQSLAYDEDKIIGRCDYQIKEGKWYSI